MTTLLSFVGSSDPFSRQQSASGADEGAIVTLVRHLQAMDRPLTRVVLLATRDMEANGADVRDWLIAELGLAATAVTLRRTSAALSDDPINPHLAWQDLLAAWTALTPQERQDCFFNGSSGTPAMIQSVPALIVSGLLPGLTLWQVRPRARMLPGQAQVFPLDLQHLHAEFHRHALIRLIERDDFDGALLLARDAGWDDPVLQALLTYARHRQAFRFADARASLDKVPAGVMDRRWQQEAGRLAQGDIKALSEEIYWNARSCAERGDAIDAIGRIYRAIEAILARLACDRLQVAIPGEGATSDPAFRKTKQRFWFKVLTLDNGRLCGHLGASGAATFAMPASEAMAPADNVYWKHYETILGYFVTQRGDGKLKDAWEAAEALNQWRNLRNRTILAHGWQGLTEIPDAAALWQHLKVLTDALGGMPQQSPWHVLREQCRQRLLSTGD